MCEGSQGEGEGEGEGVESGEAERRLGTQGRRNERNERNERTESKNQLCTHRAPATRCTLQLRSLWLINKITDGEMHEST